MDKTKILFVCLGNICRSPAAEAVFKSIVDQQKLTDYFEIDSAGTTDYNQGKPADSRMRTHAMNRGIVINSVSRKISAQHDFNHFDLIICMDDANMANLKTVAPDSHRHKKLHKMTDFSVNYAANFVPDPYYGTSEQFELVLDLLQDACTGLMQHLITNKYQTNS